MARRDLAAQLGKVPIFSACSRRELEAILDAAKEVSHPAGHVIAREGESGVGFFMITEGEAVVSIGGRTRARLGPGDFFGEVSVLDGGPRTASVTAASPIKLVGLTSWVFRGLLTDHPSIGLKLLEVVARRLRETGKERIA